MNGENPDDLDWLDKEGWKALPFPTDPKGGEIHQVRLLVRVYLDGCVAMYNEVAKPPRPYKVTRIVVDQKGETPPLLFTVSAFLNPFVRRNPLPQEGLTHLIPPEPDPPDLS